MLATLQFGNINRGFDLPHEARRSVRSPCPHISPAEKSGTVRTAVQDGSEFQSYADRPAAYARAER